ncbi:MAG: secondary thiamine-phosphate synthase enzyme YjbQ [Elusimicrobiales bacterium]|nr:secondary thiamine-phosphate synthase enzyme YjbQ [Elusimicrobiales bacterium]
MIKEIVIRTSNQQQIIDITSKVEHIIKSLDIDEGVCFIYNPHTTAALFINEGADPSVCKDILDKLNFLIDPNDKYKHLEGNSHAHIKSVVIGNSLTIFIKDGNLVLGRWQSIYFFEGDGPRERTIFIKVLKG